MTHHHLAMCCPACGSTESTLIATAVRDGRRAGYAPVCLGCDFEGPVAATSADARDLWAIAMDHAAE